MSRIGKTPVVVPNGVSVKLEKQTLLFSGPKGTSTLVVPEDLEIKLQDNNLEVCLHQSKSWKKNIHGLFRALCNNAIFGVKEGWQKTLELIGVGFRVTGGGNEITLIVGFTHPVKFTAPAGITFQIQDNTKIVVVGVDKSLVGEMAAKIRAIKPPEPYKGKGIRYLGEIVRKKAGKAVKAAGSPA